MMENAGLAALFLSSFLSATLLPDRLSPRGLRWASRYGPPALLFARAPIIGDALCAAAGKFLRYWAVAHFSV